MDRPHTISPDSLMGRMPKSDKVLKCDVLKKLSMSYEWKAIQLALTSAGLYMARPGEDLLRDLIMRSLKLNDEAMYQKCWNQAKA